MALPAAQHILLCLRYGIGDLVMELPALEALRQFAPTAHITALGARPAIELLENDPRVDALACVQDFGLEHWGDWGNPQIKTRIGAWLDRQDCDLIIDPSHAVLAVGEVIWARHTAILDTEQQVQNQGLAEGLDGIAAIKAAVKVGWGLEVPAELLPRLYLKAADVEIAEQFIRSQGLQHRPLVGLSPVASSPLKRWPVDRLAAVANWLIEEREHRLLLFCGPQQDLAATLLARIRQRHSVMVIGGMHLRQVGALLARCTLFIGNDTGLMHIAAAVGTPVIAVFGPTSPAIYLPPGGRAVGWDSDCPYRKTREFGPSECLILGRCLRAGQGCIETVGVEELTAVAQAYL